MSDSSIDIEDFYMNYNNAIMNSYEMDAIQKHYQETSFFASAGRFPAQGRVADSQSKTR